MPAEGTKTFEELEAWKAARALRVFVFRKIVPILQEKHEYDLVDQVKRSARSVGNNIAEGHGRYHYRDNYRFCSQARGSLMETLDHCIIAHDDSLIPDELQSEARSLFETGLKLLNGYMAWLKRSAERSDPRRSPN